MGLLKTSKPDNFHSPDWVTKMEVSLRLPWVAAPGPFKNFKADYQRMIPKMSHNHMVGVFDKMMKERERKLATMRLRPQIFHSI